MGNPRLDINWKEMLQEEYILNKKSCVTIAKEYNCGRATVLRRLHKFGFIVRGTADVLKGVKRSVEFCETVSKATKGLNIWMKGRSCPEVVKRKISITKKGSSYSESHCKAISKARKGMKFTEEHCKSISKAKKGIGSGKEHWNWKGGITPKSIAIRMSSKYKDWRLAVFSRDKFTCVGCGDKRGHNLHAHHIMPFAEYPELRFDISNGTTLCKRCHAKLHPELKIIYLEGA